jgi:Arc/MetJ-type ribon-helix-helix transcriptional regulator
MASGSVSVRLSEEVLEALEELAQERGQKVSDVVRELIVSGLALEKEGTRELLNRMERLENISTKAAMAAGKAQFLASMSVGFCSDITKLMVAGRTPEAEEKTAFLNQTDEWAENFAQEYLKNETEPKSIK